MKWEEFVSNVQQWSKDRGIYEHSTAVAQALKACSEAGELCDAVIKGDREALVDAVGDVAVCLVNAWELHCPGISLDITSDIDNSCSAVRAASCVVFHSAESVQMLECEAGAQSEIEEALHSLQDFCAATGLMFMRCCESAWDEIKDRKGRMVPGGAFVKE